MKGKATLIIAMAAAAALSAATVIDFEELAVTNGWMQNVADGYTSQGYVFTSSFSRNDSFAVWATDNSSGFYPGSTALFNKYAGERTTLKRTDLGAFDMASIELCNVWRSTITQSIRFTGTRADASTVTNTFTLTDPANLHTFAFSGMTAIVKLEWDQLSPFNQFDNVTIVPEPASLAMLALGGLALLRRRAR